MSASSPLGDDLVIRGSMLLKVNATGKPLKKHVFVTKDGKYLKWDPSKKTNNGDFLDLDAVEAVRFGDKGKRLGALKQDDNMRIFLQQRQQYPVDDVCGWLEKQGGVKGGSKSFKQRWFVLQGASLYFFSNPTDVVYKGVLPLSGAIVLPHERDGSAFVLQWPGSGDPDRVLKTSSPADSERWTVAIRRALRVDRLRTGYRPTMGKGAAALPAGKERSADVREAAPDMNQPIAEKGMVYLSFNLKGGDAGGKKEPVALVAGSLVGAESWYLGITNAMVKKRGLDADGVIALHTACIAASSSPIAATPARVAIALALEARGEMEEALAKLKEAIAAQPYTAAGRKALGRLLLEFKNDPAAALPHLKASAALQDRQDSATLMMLGQAYERTAALRLAATAYDMALTIDPRHVPAHVALGEVLLAQGMAKEAVSHFKAALTANPEDATVHASLGTALMELGGQDEEAVASFHAALSLDQNLLAAHQALADLLPKLDRHAQAVVALRNVLVACEQGKLEGVTSGAIKLALAGQLVSAEGVRFGPSEAPAPPPPAQEEEDEDGGEEGAATFDGEGEGGEGEGGEEEAAVGATVPEASADSEAAPPPPAAKGPPAPPPPPATRVLTRTVPAPPKVGPAPEAFALSGIAAVDGVSSRALLAEASSILTAVGPDFTDGDAHALVVLLTARVADRTAQLDEGDAGGSGSAEAAAEGVKANRSKAEEGYGACMALGASNAGEAGFYLGRLLKKLQRHADAVAPLEAAVQAAADGTLPNGKVAADLAKDLLSRCKRLAAGQPEFPVVEKRKKRDEEMQYSDAGLPAGLNVDGMSAEERKKAYFAHMKAQKKAAEDEAKRLEDVKLSRMTEEEKVEYFKEKEAKDKHEARKEKVLSKQMAQYAGGTGGSSGRGAALMSRGRGRGRGRGGK